MAEERDIIFRVNVSAANANKAIIDTKREIDSLKAKQKELDTSTAKGAAEWEDYESQLRNLNQTLRQNKKQYDNTIASLKANENSVNQLKAEYALLITQINVLSEADRKSAQGLQLAQRAKEIKDALNDAGSAVGNFTGQVGNYQLATAGLGAEIQDLNRQMEKMAADGKQASQAYQDMAARAKTLQEALEGNTIQTRSLSNTTEVLSNRLRLVMGEMETLRKDGKESSDAYREMAQQASVLERALSGNTTQTRELEVANKSLFSQMRQMTQQLAEMRLQGQEGSVEYRNMALRAAELQDALADASQQVRNIANDTNILSGVNQAFQGLVGAVGLWAAAMGLASEDAEEVQKVMKNMMIVMGALNSLTAIQNALQSQSAAMNLKNIIIDKIREVQARALARAKLLEAQSTAAATVQMRIYNAVAAANPYVLILTGIGLLVGAYFALTSQMVKTTAAEKTLQDIRKAAIETASQEIAKMEVMAGRVKKAAEGRGDLVEALKAYNDEFKDTQALTEDIVRDEQRYNDFLSKRVEYLKAVAESEAAFKKYQELSTEATKVSTTFMDKVKVALVKVAGQYDVAAMEAEQLTKRQKENTEQMEAANKAYNEAREQIEKYNAELRLLQQGKEVEKLRIEAISSALEREKQLLKLSYEEKKKDAAGNNELLLALENKYQRELADIIKKYLKEDQTRRLEQGLRLLNFQKAIAEQELEIEKTLSQDKLEQTKANGGVRLAAELEFERKAFMLTQDFERQKLKLQRDTNKINAQVYQEGLQLLDVQLEAFNKKQVAKLNQFHRVQVDAISELMGESATAEINAIRKRYQDAFDELEKLQELSSDDRAVRRIGMEREQERLITEILVNAQKKRNEDELASLADNARQRIKLEIETQEKILEVKKAAGQPTGEDEARLRALKLQAIKADEAFELLTSIKREEKQYKIKKDSLEKQLELYRDNADKTAEILQELNDLEIEHIKKVAAERISVLSGIHDTLSSVSEMMSAFSQERIQEAEDNASAEKEILQRQLDRGYLSRKEYNKKVAALDKDLAAKKAAEARKEAIRNKALAVADVSIKTAQAIMNASLTQPFFPMGMIMAGVAAAAGAVQLATIMAAPIPKAARGMKIKGKKHSQGGELVNVEDKEIIMNARSSEMFEPILSAMSVAGGGVPFGNYGGKITDGGFSMRETGRQSRESIDYGQLGDVVANAVRRVNISVAVEDINKAERKFTRVTDASIISPTNR